MKIVNFEETKAYQLHAKRAEERAQYIRDRKLMVLNEKRKKGSRLISEKQVDTAFCNMCKRAGIYIVKLHPMTDAGIPDRLLVHFGKTIFVEVKRPGEVCRETQIAQHARIHKAGASVYVIDRPVALWEDFVRYRYTTYPGPEHFKGHEKSDPDFKRFTFEELDDADNYDTFEANIPDE